MSRKNPRRGARTARRQHQYADKFLFRLPAPFYRGPDHKIIAGPRAEPITLARQNDKGTMGVLGWLVERDGAYLGYVRYKQSADFEGLKLVALDPDEEGVVWARGWDENSEAVRALAAAVALS